MNIVIYIFYSIFFSVFLNTIISKKKVKEWNLKLKIPFFITWYWYRKKTFLGIWKWINTKSSILSFQTVLIIIPNTANCFCKISYRTITSKYYESDWMQAEFEKSGNPGCLLKTEAKIFEPNYRKPLSVISHFPWKAEQSWWLRLYV